MGNLTQLRKVQYFSRSIINRSHSTSTSTSTSTYPVKKVRMAALVHRCIGIDVGSQKTMMIAEDAEIILTDTGSVSFPTLFSCSETKYSPLRILKNTSNYNLIFVLVVYCNRLRLFGEEAAAQVSESTVPMINILATMTGIEVLRLTQLHKDIHFLNFVAI